MNTAVGGRRLCCDGFVQTAHPVRVQPTPYSTVPERAALLTALCTASLPLPPTASSMQSLYSRRLSWALVEERLRQRDVAYAMLVRPQRAYLAV